ncbi:ParB/RepB/Spo0J family partition protein [Clostridiaceae bacterium]|nr:ParB/RepB/Spo0J family partition protein [Clostridiaceae bacterium]
MKSKSAEKVRLKSFDDLFGSGETVTGETVTSVPLSELHTFKDHPFRVLDDEKMQETVESVKQYGVLTPGIVRPHPQSGYEVIAGHRRWRACELAGLTEMPVIVREMDDDTAVVLMVDTNIQREDILPSEKAKAYRMKYEAMKHQGSKGEKYTADVIGEAAGDSGRTVQRYIRLSELAEELLGYVDENKIPMVAGEKLSYLKTDEQAWVVDAIGNSGIFPSKIQAEQLKAVSEAGELMEGKVYAVLVKKEKENVNVTISAKKIRNYFPTEYSKEQIEDVIYTLLEEWKQKEKEGGTQDAGITV